MFRYLSGIFLAEHDPHQSQIHSNPPPKTSKSDLAKHQHLLTRAAPVGGGQGGNSLLESGPDPSRLGRQGRDQPGSNLGVLVEGCRSSGGQLADGLVQKAPQALRGLVQLRVGKLCTVCTFRTVSMLWRDSYVQ